MKAGRKNLIAIICVFGVMGMTGAAFAAVPLYRMFCQVTGFGGTTMKADKASDTVLDETVLVRFDTNVRGVPMTFRAEQSTQRVRIGETGLAYFDVTNTSDKPIQVRASYNVSPEQTGPYFQKLQCFCFTDQTLAAGETRQFPVQYFIAPELATDREAKGARDITLSYTFYPSVDAPKA
ncbi:MULTISPECIES: cytochrome c oxidase assembly protein [Brevundimonas]|jgi:cytochrome c oxidase assembly protein subunit 11|uniref:Cytochrome c oxidase assembly protein n=2 Tax=Brevundimonas TaxID=41275 RepID=A0ACD4VS02_9CAUL|nr:MULTISPECIES: cytochrome c oxidase assembly protein [Brevundimonas]KJV43085.1 cytochrome C oxidase assembly protein [Brevundimonas sp. KM4]MCW0045822.1 cytochrome c oxidase assembly protein [Brevundimonas sp. BT-123]NSX34589.1 cytochrome c oxidase assembly protein [Brevundimonas vesicularis]QSF54103.1 cytochrome c oxidase assembly protein [Brevundimonas fontaquae]WBT05929.1 cytochrome c oxidase assembly protein [Brevundimonas vesicularis]